MSEIIELFKQCAEGIQEEYVQKRRILSYGDYMSEMATRPRTHLRDSSRYLLDAIDSFGSYKVSYPWGDEKRFGIFDLEYQQNAERLVGQESAQEAVRDAVAAQVREGHGNRLLLIHGPNGSAKSTLINCLFRGMEEYSRMPDGEQYRFRWILPSRKTSRGNIGFESKMGTQGIDTFAHLADELIDSTLECEMRDHPLLIIPKEQRRELMEQALSNAGEGSYPIPRYLLDSSLCHRCRQVADALLRTYQGDLRKMLAHVQIERWAMSRRYRRGLVQVGPQMSTDANQRQVTADRSLSALPIELQNMTLFESFGPLVDGAGGIVEYEDMLKRPLDAFKYLLGTVETAEVAVGQAIVRVNSVLMGTTNDTMLEAFREHHDYPSFRDRMSLISVPYIRNCVTEQQIYQLQIAPKVERHVAPHAIEAAARWAVLTRLRKPNPEAYPKSLRPIISKLTAEQKCDIYDDAILPEDVPDDKARELVSSIKDMVQERASSWSYEGRHGASPRLIRQVLLRSSLSNEFSCLSPFPVLEELEAVCGRTHEHPFLDREAEPGGYHEHLAFVRHAEERVLDWIEDDVRTASGLIEESRYAELFEKYVNHVSNAVKGEKVLDENTGEYIDPDESMMKSVEKTLEVGDKPDEFRGSIISKIAAHAIDHPGKKVKIGEVFPDYLGRLRKSYFEQHRAKVAKIARISLAILMDETDAFDKQDIEAGKRLNKKLIKKHGYCESCARDALGRIVSQRFDRI